MAPSQRDPYTIDNADGNIDNVDNISSILALDNVTSSGVPADGQVLKWNGSSWYVADDNESSTSLDGGLLRNVENSNFAADADLAQTKVNGLAAELVGKVDVATPSVTSGSIEFTNNLIHQYSKCFFRKCKFNSTKYIKIYSVGAC